MAKRDYYDVLGVNKSSTPDQIKTAYRKLAVKHHPDKNKGNKASEEKFKEASEAYHVLSDNERKQSYDNFGHAAFENGAGGKGGFGNFDFSSSFSDIFEDFFQYYVIKYLPDFLHQRNLFFSYQLPYLSQLP